MSKLEVDNLTGVFETLLIPLHYRERHPERSRTRRPNTSTTRSPTRQHREGRSIDAMGQSVSRRARRRSGGVRGAVRAPPGRRLRERG
jgi:hypothetical protein